MKNSKNIIVTLLIILAVSPSIRAQYRWHIVHSDRIDSLFYQFSEISCSGESCSALGFEWLFGMEVSNIILHSTDGGQTWDSVEGTLPQSIYTWNSQEFDVLHSVEQIDSLNVIVGGTSGTFIRTSDGWKTWRADTFNFPPVVLYRDTQAINITETDFSDLAEGVLFDSPDGALFWTTDTGQHWVEQRPGGNMHPYGNGMWREYRAGYNFNDPDTILTTLDNWNTMDTATFTWNGPFLKGDLTHGNFEFGAGDTLVSFAFRYDSTGINQIFTMVQSTDLGENWYEIPVPSTNRITNAIVSPLDGQTIVVAGQDSTGEILLSSDHGATWELDTVPLDNGIPYTYISAISVTGSGRVIASIETDSNVEGSMVLAYLEPIPSVVASQASIQQKLTLYPNPSTNILNLESPSGNISILDPLGRNHAVPRNGDELDVSSLPSGVYFVSDGHSRAKFVKE
jgi:photosystem II stability/assembly factor-like uncharacterized protein